MLFSVLTRKVHRKVNRLLRPLRLWTIQIGREWVIPRTSFSWVIIIHNLGPPPLLTSPLTGKAPFRISNCMKVKLSIIPTGILQVACPRAGYLLHYVPYFGWSGPASWFRWNAEIVQPLSHPVYYARTLKRMVDRIDLLGHRQRHREGNDESLIFLCSRMITICKYGIFSFTFLQIKLTAPSFTMGPRPPGTPLSYSKWCFTVASLALKDSLNVEFTFSRCWRMNFGVIALATEMKTENFL